MRKGSLAFKHNNRPMWGQAGGGGNSRNTTADDKEICIHEGRMSWPLQKEKARIISEPLPLFVARTSCFRRGVPLRHRQARQGP